MPVNARIIIIGDDDPEQRINLGLKLKEQGFTPRLEESAAETLMATTALEAFAVISDVDMMPTATKRDHVLYGPEVVAHARELGITMPMFLHSAKVPPVQKFQIQRMLEDGRLSGFLEKPLSAKQFPFILQAMLAHPDFYKIFELGSPAEKKALLDKLTQEQTQREMINAMLIRGLEAKEKAAGIN